MAASYELIGNLSESQVEADVATYLGWCTPEGANAPWRLVDVNEQLTGADKAFYDSGAVVYLQFKKSSGLRGATKVSTSKKKGRLQLIREYRREVCLFDNPSLYFQLREKAKNAADWQHNVLIGRNRPPISHAVYVAPLMLDHVEYSNALYASRYRDIVPFSLSDDIMCIRQSRWASYYNMIPFLRCHICIAPTERVATHQHFYSYAPSGSDIAWHSQEVLQRGPSRLSDFLGSYIHRFIFDPKSRVGIGELREAIEDLNGDLQQTERASSRRDHWDAMSEVGKRLQAIHGIRQMLFLASSESLRRFVRD